MSQTAFNEKRKEHWDKVADRFKASHSWGLYYREVIRGVYGFLVPEGADVLEVGCGDGDLLNAVRPERGVGIDISPRMIEKARTKYPALDFVCCEAMDYAPGRTFDVIILSDVLNDMWDIQAFFRKMREWCHPGTRIIMNSFSRVWQLPLGLARKHGLATPLLPQNWLTRSDIVNLLELEGYSPISFRDEVVFPVKLPVLSNLLNRYFAKIFPINLLAMTHFVVARLEMAEVTPESTVSVVVAARNEEGNISNIFDRVPQMGGGLN